MRTAEQAVAAARQESRHPTRNLEGLCLGAVRSWWGFAPSGIYDANEAWRLAQSKHTGRNPPRGAPMYWAVGNHGHIAISSGDGDCYSTDIKRRGKVDWTTISEVERKWGARYRGWSSDYAGTPLPVGRAAKAQTATPVKTSKGAGMSTVLTSLGDVRAHTRKVAGEVADRFGPLYFIWGDGPSGEHAQGRALDFMTMERGGGVNSPGPYRVKLGQDIADYLWANRDRLGVWYVIYRQRIISTTRPAAGWKPMADRGGPTANHMDHVHVSFDQNPPAYRAPASGAAAAAAEEEDPMATARRVNDSTGRDTPLKARKWRQVRLRGNGGVSILGERQSPCRWSATVGLTIEGLPEGRTVQARFVEYDPDRKKIVSRGYYPLQEIVGTSGKTFATLTHTAGWVAPGRRLRVIVAAFDDGVKITRASVQALHTR